MLVSKALGVIILNQRQGIYMAKVTNEQVTLALITITPPLVALLYFDWRAALTAFLLTQIALGLMRERVNG